MVHKNVMIIYDWQQCYIFVFTKSVVREVKFDVKSEDFLRTFFFRNKKSDVKKLNILRVVPMTTLLDQTAVFFKIYFSPAVAVQNTTYSGS